MLQMDKNLINRKGTAEPKSSEKQCKNAFAMAQEQFRTKNKKVPNIVNEFDFDDASADRRIDALVKAKNLAETIAESCIDKDAEYDFDGEWIKLNIPTVPPFNDGEKKFNYSLAAAIWMLDAIRTNHRIDDALAILPRDKEKLDSVKIPSCTSPCYSEAVIRSMVYVILHRNEDCVGIDKPEKPPLEFPVTDSYTAAGTQHQSVDSRNLFDSLIGMISQESINEAVNSYSVQIRDVLSRYYSCLSKLLKQKQKYQKIIKNLIQEMDELNAEATELSNKSHSIAKAKAMPLPTNHMAGLSTQSEMTIQLSSLMERGKTTITQIEANQEKRSQAEAKIRDFLYDSIERSWWPEEAWAEKYSEEIANRVSEFETADPYEICFAFYYLLDKGEYLPWLYYPTSVLLSYAATQLPWCGGDIKKYLDATDTTSADVYESTKKLNLHKDNSTEDSESIQIRWNTLSLILEDPEEGTVRFSPSTAIYSLTDGTIVPRNTADVDELYDSLSDGGVGDDRDIALYSAYVSVLSNLKDRIDFPDSTDGNKDKQEIAQLKAQCNAYELELEQLKAECEKKRQAVYKADKTIAELKSQIEEDASERQKEKQELNDLRELIYILTNDAASDEKEPAKTQTEFPYHTSKKHIVYGGHPTWLKAIRPMVPDVKFVEGFPSTEQIKGAEIVWLQTNYLSHKAFYKIIDIVRSKNIPLRYFTSASATKCAEQLVKADGEVCARRTAKES